MTLSDRLLSSIAVAGRRYWQRGRVPAAVAFPASGKVKPDVMPRRRIGDLSSAR